MLQILEILAGSDKPLISAQIVGALFGSKKQSCTDEVEQALLELIRSENAFEHPPRRRGERKRFWTESPTALTAARILEILATKERLTLRNVREAIPTSYRGFFDEALGSLMREKRVYPLTVGKVKYLLNRAPKPTEHLLRRHLTALKDIVEEVSRRRKAKLSVSEVMRFLDGCETVIEPGMPAPKQIPEKVMSSWYKEDLARLMGSKSVPIPWTWSRYEKWCREQRLEADLPGFHQMLRLLAHAGKIELVPHGMSQPIDPEELPIAIKTDRGELLYYWKWLQEDTK